MAARFALASSRLHIALGSHTVQTPTLQVGRQHLLEAGTCSDLPNPSLPCPVTVAFPTWLTHVDIEI
jgi:hypothetical protein